MGFHHCDLRLCIILRLTGFAPTPDKEVSVGCDEQTKEDKCVSHIYWTAFLFQSNGGAICDYEKHRATSTAKFRVIQVNTYHGIGTFS